MALTVAELLATITLDASGATAGAAEVQQAVAGANEQLTALTESAVATSEQLSLLSSAAEEANGQMSIFAPAIEEANQQLDLFAAGAAESYQQLQEFSTNAESASGQMSLFAPAVEETAGQISLFNTATEESYQALQQFSSGAEEAANSAQNLGGAAEGTAGFMQGLLSSAGGAASAIGSGLSSAAGTAAGALGLLGGVSASGILGFLGLAGGAFELVRGLEDAAKTAIAWGEEVRRIQIITDLSAQGASDLAVAMEFVGLNVNVATRSLALFESHVQSGTGRITQFFSATELANMHNQTLAQMLPELSARFQSLGSETEKTAFLVGVFGTRIGPQMHNLLSLSTQDLAALTAEAKANGLELSQGQVDSAHAAQLAMNNLTLAWKAAEVSLGQELMPAFAETIKFLSFLIAGFVTAAKVIVDAGAAIGHAASAIYDAFTFNFGGAANQIEAAKGSINNLTKDAVAGWHQMEQAAHGMSTGVSEAINNELTASKALTDEQKKAADMARQDAQSRIASANSIEKAQQALVKQQQEYNKFIQDEPIKVWVDEVNALKSVYDAELKVTDAQQALNDLLAGPTVEASQKAIDAIDNAVASLFDNQQKVIAAQQAINDIMNPPQTAKDKAQEDVAKAQIGVEKATSAVTAAERNLAIVRGYGASTAQQITDATIALQEAQFGVTDANNTLTDAQTALNKLTTDAIPGSVALVTAQNNLTLAQDAVKDSVNNLTAAERAQADLSPTSVASQRAIATASEDLASAQAGLFTQVMNATVAVAEATAFQQGGIPATQAYQDESTKLKDAQFSLSQAIATANNQMITQGEAMDAENQKLAELTQSLEDMQAAAAAAIQTVAGLPGAPPGGPTYNIGGLPDVHTAGQPWNATGLTWQAKVQLIGADAAQLQQLQNWVNSGGNPDAILAAIRAKGYSPYNGISLPPGFHSGGLVMHGGGLAPDEISSILQRGEFVMNKNTVSSIGPDTMAAINSSGRLPPSGGSTNVTIPVYLDGRQIATVVRQIFISDIQTGRVTNLGFK